MGDMNFSLTTFNKTGKLMQIENALARVQQGKMALGIRGKRGSHLFYVIIDYTWRDLAVSNMVTNSLSLSVCLCVSVLACCWSMG